MRSSSGNRKVRGYEPKNPVRPDLIRTGGTSSAATPGWDGMGMGGGSSRAGRKGRSSSYKEWKPDSAQDQAPFTERRAREFAFAAKALPEQHPGFCVVAMIAIQMRGETPTREKVLERLTASGREASQIGYGPGGYAA